MARRMHVNETIGVTIPPIQGILAFPLFVSVEQAILVKALSSALFSKGLMEKQIVFAAYKD